MSQRRLSNKKSALKRMAEAKAHSALTQQKTSVVDPLAPRPFLIQPQTISKQISRTSEVLPDQTTPWEKIGSQPQAAPTTQSQSLKSPIIQRKMRIGEPGDRYEQEADRVADQVVKQINSPQAKTSGNAGNSLDHKASVQRAKMPEEDELQMQAIGSIQRVDMLEEEDELQMKPLQRSADGRGKASQELENAIARERGGGQPLDLNLQRQMGQAMGANFSGVRVHTDGQSDQLNQSIQAKAFTTGQDVFFRQGAYQPRSREGQQLIAHELTHVIQQHGGTQNPSVQRKYDKEQLEATIKEVYKNIGKEATEKDFVVALKKFAKESKKTTEEIFGDPDFAWHLMQLVGDESGKKLHEQIKESSDNKGKAISYKFTPVFKGKWTLRTYTTSKNKEGKAVTPSYTDLKPTAELLVSGIKDKSDNTNDADWNKIGNVGFTFHLLCIDGKVPDRTFLSQCTHYAEFDMSSIPNMFVSGDMLGTTGKTEEKKPGGFKGNGDDVKAALCSLTVDKSDAKKFLKGIDSIFGNFEVKVPGQLKVTEWHEK